MNCNIYLESGNIINTCTCTHQTHRKCIDLGYKIYYDDFVVHNVKKINHVKYENIINDK